MKTPVAPKSRLSRHLGPIALLAIAGSMQVGCTREFYREWANQDVSEAVFEKSRDPRFRLELFSVEPPALSRFADPYDQDTPPAPPDDRATEALSVAPQWPDHRLLIPVEGTGYLDMLDAWKRERVEPPDQNPPRGTRPGTLEPPTAPPAGSPSPFPAAPNSGPNAPGMSPSYVPGAAAANPTGFGANPPQTRVRKTDLGTRLAAFQATGLPMPMPARAEPPQGPPRDLPTPPIGMDPLPINSDLSAPFNPRQPGVNPEQYRAAEALGAEMAGVLIPGEIDFDDAEAAGLPRGSKPYVVTLEQAFILALINSRVYQFQLENLYGTALTVTLQRFAFQPQFFAGLSPTTGVPSPNAVPFAVSPVNQFLYRTRETGSPLSSLSIGDVAGFGKLFNSGARLITGFANQVVFNFLGKNSAQPTVQSFLPLTLVQPFLAGGGRAVTLENLSNAERQLVYQVRVFTQFRQQFMVAVLVGGNIPNFGSAVPTVSFSAGGNSDPSTGFVNVVQDIQEIENDRKNIAAFERLVEVYRELIQGESSGLSQLQLDQVESRLQNARQAIVSDRQTYRNDLDSFKQQMGLPPDTPLVVDRSLTQPFKNTFNDIDEWQRKPDRDMSDLPKLAAQLPELEDVIIDGRSVLGVYKGKTFGDESDLESLLVAAGRVAMERRLDLMNTRAQLYDAWRQIRFTANALMGVFNLTLTNQYLTPPTTTNPLGFLEQSKQFSLVINAELPLVRLSQRNNFRAALIQYQRQRRALMNMEDSIKLLVREDVRAVHTSYLNYEINRRNLVLTIRQKDQAFEQILAPPAGATGAAQAAQAATQTTNLINFQNQLLTIQNALVMGWQTYQLQRLSLYRDLGTLPYDEWEAYHELFPTVPVNRDDAGKDRTLGARSPRGASPAAAEVIRQ